LRGWVRRRLIERWRLARRSEVRAASLVVAAALLTTGAVLLIDVAVRHERAIADGLWLYRPFLYLQLVSTQAPFLGLSGTAARLARVLGVAIAGAVALVLYRLAPLWSLDQLPGSIRVGVGVVAGGLVSNMVELGWLGGATDFIGVPHDGVYSLGDLGLRIGATVVVAGWWASPRLWPEWLFRYRIGWLWLAIAPGVVYLAAQDRWGVLGWVIVLAAGWLLGTVVRNRGRRVTEDALDGL
jgi:hypothetical protein